MAGFLYFIDGLTSPVTDAVIDAKGLRYAFPDRPPMNGPISGRTPTGRPGTLLADSRRLGQGDLVFRGENEQIWHQRPGSDVWVGAWRAWPPEPADLAHKRQLPGQWVRMADGKLWKVPQLMVYSLPQQDADGNDLPGSGGFSIDLPCYIDTNEAGALCPGETVEEYQPAASLAERVYTGLLEGMSIADAVRASVELLAINYAVSQFEATRFLRLFRDDGDLKAVCKAAADWQTFEDWYEKKTAAGAPAASAG